MTAKQKILKLMSRRYHTNAGHCIAQLGLNQHTARGRLSELDGEGLVRMVVRGTPGTYSEYAEYVLTEKGRVVADQVVDLADDPGAADGGHTPAVAPASRFA